MYSANQKYLAVKVCIFAEYSNNVDSINLFPNNVLTLVYRTGF